MTEGSVSRRRYERQYEARREAERLLEQKSLDLFKANQRLMKLNATLEEKVRERTEELLQANKVREQFLAHMSHELRTPLNAIIGFSDCISGELFGSAGDPRYVEYAQLIHRSGEHLLSLISDILNFSKLDSGQGSVSREEVKIRCSILEALSFIQPAADDKNIQLDWRIRDEGLVHRADPRALLQMLLNLLSNAVKHTPEGGRVAIFCVAGRENLRLCVADTGVGIAPEDIHMVLQPFGQVQTGITSYAGSKPGSTGLGLPIVKSLMDLHGGSFSLRSLPGKGTLAVLKFPFDSDIA